MRYIFILIVFVVLACNKRNEIKNYNEIVVTIDDAPAFETERVLDVLKEYNVKATFFCVGQAIYEKPLLAERIVKDGHHLGNHTFTHINIMKSTLSDALFDAEISRTQIWIDSILNEYDKPLTKYFRPPYSALTNVQKNKIIDTGYEIVMWDVGAEDWNNSVSVNEIVDTIVSKVENKNGIPILLFHLSDHTVQALGLIFDELVVKRGINIVSLEERKEILAK